MHVPTNRTGRLALAAVLALVALPGVARADDAALEKRVKDLEETVRQLQEQLKQNAQKTQETVAKAVDDKVKKSNIPSFNWNRGLSLSSPDGRNRLHVGGVIQSNVRDYTSGTAQTNTDSFYIAKARPVIEGTVEKYIDFRLMPDFGFGNTVLQDAYVELNYWPEARLRTGKFKAPFSLERLQSDTDVQFVDRSLANNLAPNRDIGFQLGGDFFKGRLSYQLAVANGVVDGGSADADVSDDKDFVGRVFAQPWKTQKDSPLQGLGFGAAWSTGYRTDSLSGLGYRTAGRATFFKYKSSVTESGDHWRFSPQANYYYGPFSLMGEYIVSHENLLNGATTTGIKNTAYVAQATYVLTGEKATYRGVDPRKPFDPHKHQWGAFELGARYARLHIDSNAFTAGLADAATNAGDVGEFTLGLNWYLNRSVKWAFNYVRTDFDRPLTLNTFTGKKENAFLGMLQVQF